MKFVVIFLFIFTLTFLSLSWGLNANTHSTNTHSTHTLNTLALNALGLNTQKKSIQDPAAPDKRALMAQGQLMSVQVVPMDKTAKLYLLGNKMGESKTVSKPKLLQVVAFNQNQEEELLLTPEGHYYSINHPKLSKPYSLRVRAQLNQKEEKFEINVPNTMP